MNKERMAQIAEKSVEKHGHVAREVEEERIVAEQRKQAEEAMKQREIERVAANQRYQEQLQLQLQVNSMMCQLISSHCVVIVSVVGVKCMLLVHISRCLKQ